jgi:hypothetical protein
MIEEVVRADDAELAEGNEGANFRITKTITAVTIVDRSARVFETDIGKRPLGRRSWVARWLGRTSAICLALWLPEFGFGRVLASGLDRVEEVLPFAEWIESRHG